MRTRMMALFALIAFCVMPIEAKKVKGNGDIITKEISVRDYSAIKVAQPPWDIATVGSAYSAVGEIRRTFSDIRKENQRPYESRSTRTYILI